MLLNDSELDKELVGKLFSEDKDVMQQAIMDAISVMVPKEWACGVFVRHDIAVDSWEKEGMETHNEREEYGRSRGESEGMWVLPRRTQNV